MSAPNGLKHTLPEDYSPSEFDFVIGRGKQVKQHAGNQRLYNQIRSIADDYTNGDKARKSYLLSHLVSQVYEKSPDAGFVKRDPTTGRWYAVEDALARTSAAQAVRDCLCNHYKSSRQFKQQRRRRAKQATQMNTDFFMFNNHAAPTTSLSLVPPPMARMVTPDDSYYHSSVLSTTTSKPLSSASACSPFTSSSSDSNGNDLFSILASAFANSHNDDELLQEENPFEPNPIMEQPQDQQQQSSASRMQSILHSIDMALEMPILDALPTQVPMEPQVGGLFADTTASSNSIFEI